MNQHTNEDKYRILSKMYFGISDSENHDVNPFTDIPTFLKAKVKAMHWGKQKKASKERFCKKFIQVLDMYDIKIAEETILKSLEKEEVLNNEIVKIWAAAASFEYQIPMRQSA